MTPEPEEAAPVAALVAEAAAIGIALPEACVPGVIANRRLLESHAALVARFLDAHPEA